MLSDLIKEEESPRTEVIRRNWTWYRWVSLSLRWGLRSEGRGRWQRGEARICEDKQRPVAPLEPQNPYRSLIASKPPATEQSDACSRGALVFTQQLMLLEAGLYLKHSNLGSTQSISAQSPSFPWDSARPILPTRLWAKNIPNSSPCS